MHSTRFRSVRRTRSLTLRVDRAGETRFALALITLLGLATLSVVATTVPTAQQQLGHSFTLTR
jgi:hypothetical protein